MCCKGEARTEGSGRGHHLARMDSGFGWMVHSPADSFESVVVGRWWEVGSGEWRLPKGKRTMFGERDKAINSVRNLI